LKVSGESVVEECGLWLFLDSVAFLVDNSKKIVGFVILFIFSNDIAAIAIELDQLVSSTMLYIVQHNLDIHNSALNVALLRSSSNQGSRLDCIKRDQFALVVY
jgi:hypothetical protein